MSEPPREILACPSCRGDLVDAPKGLACSNCILSFPLRSGVPELLLAESSSQQDSTQAPGGQLLQRLVAAPFVYDLVQRFAGSKKIFRRIRPVLAQANEALVLDVGAGTGNLEPLLPPSARYVWLDADQQKLAGFRAKSKAPAMLADATRIPLKDQSVDWGLSVGVSHHLNDYELGRMLDELRRVVRRRIVFLEPVVSPARLSRLLWHYDRGRHPRTSEVLRAELATRFEFLSEEEFTILHRYLFVTAR